MEKIKEEIKYIQPQGYDLLEFMQNEFINIGIEKGIEKHKIEIATNMILEGETDEKIMKYTKLTLQQIQKLREDLLVLA